MPNALPNYATFRHCKSCVHRELPSTSTTCLVCMTCSNYRNKDEATEESNIVGMNEPESRQLVIPTILPED
jgi:hypothetical protein